MQPITYLLKDFSKSLNDYPELKTFLEQYTKGLEFPIDAVFHELNDESRTVIRLPNNEYVD